MNYSTTEEKILVMSRGELLQSDPKENEVLYYKVIVLKIISQYCRCLKPGLPKEKRYIIKEEHASVVAIYQKIAANGAFNYDFIPKLIASVDRVLYQLVM